MIYVLKSSVSANLTVENPYIWLKHTLNKSNHLKISPYIQKPVASLYSKCFSFSTYCT
jgi:NurA-like 5'-3' nuclease